MIYDTLLAQLTVFDPSSGNNVTIYMSSAGQRPGGNSVLLDGKTWIPCISQGPTFRYDLSRDGQPAVATVDYGELQFRVSSDLTNRAWMDLAYDGGTAQLWAGQAGQPFSSYELIFTGLLGELGSDGYNTAGVGLRGSEAALTKDMLTLSYAGTGGAEGGEDIKGNLKPFAIGRCENIQAVCVDVARQVYQFHGYGAAGDVLDVYENASSIGARVTNACATYADLIALDMPNGSWAKAPAAGMFRLANAPTGAITADVVGALDGATSVARVGAAVSLALRDRAGLAASAISQGSITALDASFPRDWCAYVTDQVSVGDWCRDGLQQVNGYMLANAAGQWFVGRNSGGKVAVALNGDRSSLPLVNSYTKVAGTSSRAWQVRVGGRRAWYVNSATEVSDALKTASQDAVAAKVIATTAVNQIATISQNPNLDTVAPATPSGLALTSNVAADGRSTNLTVAWTANGESDFASYELQLATNGGGWVTVATGTSTTFTQNGILPGTSVQARIRALDIATNRSAYSSTVSHTTARDTTPPAAPTNLVASPGFNTVNLSVACPTDADVKAIRFWSASTNDFSKATPAGQVNAPNPGATVRFAAAQAAGTSLYWFATAFDTSLNESAATAGVLSTVTKLSEADFLPGLYPTLTVASAANLPASTGSGRLVYVSNEAKTYRDTSSGWSKGTDGADITTGSIQAAAIASGAITASKIGVLAPSLFPDGQMMDAAWWTSASAVPNVQAGNQQPANAWYIDGNPDPGTVGAKGSLYAWVTSNNVNGNTSNNIQIFAPAVAGVIPGEYYEFKATLFNSSNRPRLQMVAQWFSATGTYLGGDYVTCANDTVSRQMSFQSRAPQGATAYRLYWDGNGSTAGFTGQLYVGGITVRQCGGGTLIVDGSITTAKITADKISGNVLQVGTVNADRLQSATSLPATLKIGPTGFDLSTVNAATAVGNSGANRVPYSDMVLGTTKWGSYWNTANGWQGAGWNYYGSFYQNRRFLKLENNNASAGQDFAIYSVINNDVMFQVSGGERLSVSCRVEGQNLSGQIVYIWFYDASGNQIGNPPVILNVAPQTFGTLVGGFVDVPVNAVKGRFELHGTVSANGYASLLLCEPMVCQAAPGQIYYAAYNDGPNRDAAAVVNANTTRIDPGMITVSGATTLSNWRYGGDTTKINGGNIAANTVTANKISIGVRGVQPINLYFDTDRNQTVTWNNGIIEYYDEAYNRITTQLNAGSCTRNINSGGTGVILVWFDRGQVGNAGNGVTNLYAAETSVANVSSNPNNVILALYFGYNSLQVSYGQTVIDGDYVKTGTVNANRLIANTITSRELSANSIQAGHITASSIDTSKITIGGVATGNIAGQAVNNVILASDGAHQFGSGGGSYSSNGATITSTGGTVRIDYSVAMSKNANSGYAYCQLQRDYNGQTIVFGSAQYYAAVGGTAGAGAFSGFVIDSLPPGASARYYFYYNYNSASQGGAWNYEQVLLTEIKR